MANLAALVSGDDPAAATTTAKDLYVRLLQLFEAYLAEAGRGPSCPHASPAGL